MLSGASLITLRCLGAHTRRLPMVTQAPPASAALCRRLWLSGERRRRGAETGPPAAGRPPEWNAAALAARLYRLLPEQERVLLVSERSAAAALEQLRHLAFSETQLLELLLAAPHLLRRGPAGWAAAVPTLLDHGCAPQQVLDMLAACPALLDCGRRQLADTMDTLLAGLSAADAALLELVGRQPRLLLLPAAQLRRRLAALRTVFTAEQATRVALRCPAALLETSTNIGRKLDYLLDEMGLTPAEVAHSAGMAFPLEHVRARHQALDRSGGYRRPQPKDTAPSGNPNLTEIVDTSDEVFCQRVARLPLREYEVFVRMLQEELDDEEQSEEDSDSDLDEETTDYSSKGRRGR